MGRVEETNKALIELKDTVIKALKETSDVHATIAHAITLEAGVNEEIAKNLALLADDIHYIKEAMAKEKEAAKERSKLTCANCKYSYVIDHIDTGFLTRFNVEFCHRRDAEVDFRFTPICKHFEQKEDEAAAAVEEKEEPKYTCKDCTEYQMVRIEEPNEMAHWCALHCCTISEEGLREPCSDFVKDGEFS